MHLCRAERAVQDRCDYFESELPLRPEGAEEVEDDKGFGHGAEEGGGEGEDEEAGEEDVAGWVEAVEDDGDMGEEFADYVEGAWERKFSSRWVVPVVEKDGKGEGEGFFQVES